MLRVGSRAFAAVWRRHRAAWRWTQRVSGMGSQPQRWLTVSSRHTATRVDDTAVKVVGATAVRSHMCGSLREEHIGSQVSLCGWVQTVRAFGAFTFIVLRDCSGTVQVMVRDEDGAGAATYAEESVLRVQGVVHARPEDMVNADMATGGIDVAADSVEVLNKASNVPIRVESTKHAASNEEAQLRHRHVDLRRAALQRNLRVRSKVTAAIRGALSGLQFVEVETPTLFRTTSEGAREFLVPTRHANKFYALPQSPQQYKQLLMVGGLDRYFQIARCYRDEGGRSDRQPEFTQVDLEMSFVGMADVMACVESLVRAAWDAALDCRRTLSQFPALPNFAPLPSTLEWVAFDDAMRQYGSDKPDRRLGMSLVDITAVPSVAESTFEPVREAAAEHKLGDEVPHGRRRTTQVINAKQLGGALSRKALDGLLQSLRAHTESGTAAATVVPVKVGADGAWGGGLAKHFSPQAQADINEASGAEEGDLLLMAVGPGYSPYLMLGNARLAAAALQDSLLPEAVVDEVRGGAGWSLTADMFWVVNFPAFEQVDDETVHTTPDGSTVPALKASHHPFTLPIPEHLSLLTSHDYTSPQQLLAIRSQHYDLVCNGVELGGGSVRIHNADVQRHVFDNVLNLPEHKVKDFNHLVTALSHGAPPHGGFALGLDRFVATLCGASSLRDVIAFPKSASGKELMTGAPSAVHADDLAEYHIQPLN